MFSAATWTWLLPILAPILKAFFEGMGKTWNDRLEQQRSEQTNRDLGASQVTSQINKGTADAERKASELATNRPDVGAVIAGMERGDSF